MLILRVETTSDRHQGRGWANTPKHYSITSHWVNLPSPPNDNLKGFNEDYVCGVQSIELFHKWWPLKDIPSILSSGGSIVILSYPKRKVKFGNTQCIFKRDEGRQVGYMRPDGSLVYTDRRIKQTL